MSELYDSLWENNDFREQVASSYLAEVLKEDVELSNQNLTFIREAINVLLHDC